MEIRSSKKFKKLKKLTKVKICLKKLDFQKKLKKVRLGLGVRVRG